MRIDVDPNHLPQSQPRIPYCQISTEEKTLLAIAIIILSMLSSATWIVAFYNRPTELPENLRKWKDKAMLKAQKMCKELRYQVLKRFNGTSRSSTETNSTTSSYQIRVNKKHSSHRRVDFINLDDEIDKIMQEAIKPIPPVRQTSKHLATSMTSQLIQLSPKTHPSNEGSIIVSLSAEIDNLPEPPSISMKEIEELNKAFNNDYESPKVATPVSNEQLLVKHKTEDNDEKIKNSIPMETENFDDVKSIDMIPDKNKAVKRTSTLDLPTVNKILRKETMDVPLEKPGPQYVTDWRSIRPVGSPQVSPRWRSQSQPKEGYISKLRESFEPVQNTSVAKLKLSEDKLHEMLKSLGTKNKTNNLEDTISIHQNSARLSNIDIKTNFVNHESSYERPRSASSYYLKNSSVEKNMIV